MPKEIKITPGTPDSALSGVSGATGLPPDQPHSHGRSMYKSFLPEMASETEECSMDRSTFTWTTRTSYQRIKEVGSSETDGIGSVEKIRRALFNLSPTSQKSECILTTTNAFFSVSIFADIAYFMIPSSFLLKKAKQSQIMETYLPDPNRSKTLSTTHLI